MSTPPLPPPLPPKRRQPHIPRDNRNNFIVLPWALQSVHVSLRRYLRLGRLVRRVELSPKPLLRRTRALALAAPRPAALSVRHAVSLRPRVCATYSRAINSDAAVQQQYSTDYFLRSRVRLRSFSHCGRGEATIAKNTPCLGCVCTVQEQHVGLQMG